MEPIRQVTIEDPENRYLFRVTTYGSVEGLGEIEVKPRRVPQYIAAISATLAALAAGIILGWTSPIHEAIENGQFNNITVNNDQMGWIGSLTNIGALLACIPTGFICNLIGRKTTLMLLILPFTLGWCLVIFAYNLAMLYAGRFITGIAIGACCVAAPMYISEIAHKDIRGKLGSYFQLMVTIGVLYAYTVGAFMTPLHYTIVCACEVLLFAIAFACQPESPLYYLQNGEIEKAKLSLEKLRGPTYDILSELGEMLSDDDDESMTLWQALWRRAGRKAILISLTLMFFQQFSGINAVIFYTSDIFKNAGTTLEPKYCSIIVGAFQVVATFLSSLLVDKLGRRCLLLSSAFIMGTSMAYLGTYFYEKQHDLLPGNVGTLPIIALVVYVVAFSLGFGPIPWLLNGELFAAEIKAFASSIAGAFNWFLAFVITKYYLPLDKSYGDSTMFYTFAGMSLFATFIVWLIVPETKGKTLAEIQEELENN